MRWWKQKPKKTKIAIYHEHVGILKKLYTLMSLQSISNYCINSVLLLNIYFYI